MAWEALIEAGWGRLVSVSGCGRYVHLNFSTGPQLLDVSRPLTTPYGSVTSPLRQSSSRKDLSQRLQKFNGVGPVTTHIFLRDIKRLSVTRRPRFAECSTIQ